MEQKNNREVKLQIRYTVSLKYNSFVWLPVKTATNTLSWILPHFDFDKYFAVEDKLVPVEDQISHFGHQLNFPPNHESFTFICSIRNPYDSIFSFFKMTTGKKPDFFTKEFFSKYFENELSMDSSKFYLHKKMFNERRPDYVIRTESIYQDLIKIPYIRDSKLNTCGILEEMCEKKMNKTFDFNHREFYTIDQIKKINELYNTIFEIGGYEKWEC